MINPGLAPWAMRGCRPFRAYIPFRFVYSQGFISGFALISPWAMQEYRPCRAYLHFTTNQLLAYFDMLALTFSNQMLGSFDAVVLR